MTGVFPFGSSIQMSRVQRCSREYNLRRTQCLIHCRYRLSDEPAPDLVIEVSFDRLSIAFRTFTHSIILEQQDHLTDWRFIVIDSSEAEVNGNRESYGSTGALRPGGRLIVGQLQGSR